jgi:hypothetical protein
MRIARRGLAPCQVSVLRRGHWALIRPQWVGSETNAEADGRRRGGGGDPPSPKPSSVASALVHRNRAKRFCSARSGAGVAVGSGALSFGLAAWTLKSSAQRVSGTFA